MTPPTDFLLGSAAGRQWKRLGARRRAGVCAPLFSLRSRRSAGVGEYLDLPLLADWCRDTGQSVIQLLPLNDMGGDFAPYSAQSSFALEPLHLSLDRLKGVPPALLAAGVERLRKKFPAAGRVDYRIKEEKAALLRRAFDEDDRDDPAFADFREKNAAWLWDYAIYKILKDRYDGRAWESWPAALRDHDRDTLATVEREAEEEMLFHQWVQWQCAEQMTEARRACGEKGVLLMGDLPFLVARDSADVWAFRDAFKLELESGAPPDMYSEDGQRWGMPPYDWDRVAAGGWRYPALKLKTAERYYDLFRIDHVIGTFRLFVVPLDEPRENGARHGRFDPADRSLWEAHGRRILSMMLENTAMLPCGEDLGDVPVCSDPVLADLGVPGLNVVRWRRDWEGTKDFLAPESYRVNSCAVLSTHDSNLFSDWWTREADADEKRRFSALLGADLGSLSTEEVLRRALDKSAVGASVFCIQLAQDYWSAAGALPGDPAQWRVNVPGTVTPRNWSVVLPRPLEEWGELSINPFLKDLHARTGRG